MAMKETPKPFVKEVIIENFMSYEYARIPLKKGVNIVCGPNGSGKSSILLAIAVALGQTYTERARKLSDLIRHGKEMARVTVVFDNKPMNKARPIPNWRKDDFIVTRYLRRDGQYWHEINYRTTTKTEVKRILSRMGLNPDNMLIIMHQNTIEQFAVVQPEERLKMIEEAVGLSGYREKIIESREKLQAILGEEQTVKNLLEKANENLQQWEEEYRRLIVKRELEERKKKLTIELAWAKATNQEKLVSRLEAKLRDLKGEEGRLKRIIEETVEEIREKEEETLKLNKKIESKYTKLIHLEKELTKNRVMLKILETIEKLNRHIKGLVMDELRGVIDGRGRIEVEAEEVKSEIETVFSEIVKLKRDLEEERNRYVDLKVKEAVSRLKMEMVLSEKGNTEKELRKAKIDLMKLIDEASALGKKIYTERKIMEISDDIKMVNAQLAALKDVTPEVEKIYFNYRDLIEDLKRKAELIAENREKAVEELRSRENVWRRKLSELLGKVGETYREILTSLNAVGDVKLVNLKDVETAGIELLIGFRGSKPMILDPYIQSGGERTVGTMCFLLALQQHIKSPLRAVDEFDVHMDPRNREVILKHLLSMMEKKGAQYIVITPNQLLEVNEETHVIVVQNMRGSSKVSVVS